jgi:hypothetical protein
MQVIRRLNIDIKMSFRSRRVLECPSCGAGEDEIKDDCGRNVCTSCGIVLPGGSRIADTVAFSEHDNYKHSRRCAMSDSCPLISILREKQPGCINTAIGIINSADASLLKGTCASEHPRFAQALAYIAFRVDGQRVNIADLASQVRVPIERLRKDIKRLSRRLGIASTSLVNANDIDGSDDGDTSGDVAVFKQALIGVLRQCNLVDPTKVRQVNSWCTQLFRRALRAKDIDVINAPPKHAAEAALSIYCRRANNALGVTNKRKRDDNGGDAVRRFVASLTRHASARKAVASMNLLLSCAEKDEEMTKKEKI